MRLNSRAKGNTGEREIARILQTWWRAVEPECEFVKTPLSGGWQKPSVRGAMKLSGDLCTTALQFPFVVEVKRREGWSPKNLLAGKPCPVWGWWDQTQKSAAEQKGLPLMLFRKNHQPWSLMLRVGDANDIDDMPGMRWPDATGRGVAIPPLEWLLDLNPQHVIERVNAARAQTMVRALTTPVR